MDGFNMWQALQRGMINILFRLKMWWNGRSYLRYSKQALEQPDTIQWECLLDILQTNVSTVFGKAHQFENIRSFEDYCKAVPIQTYESLRPYIDRQIAGEPQVLTKEEIHWYAQTSGTTNQPKLLPVTTTSLAMHKLNQGVFTCIQYRENRAAFSGKLLGFAGSAKEGTLPSGIPFGSVSGVMYRKMPKIAQAKFVVPYEVFEIEDYALRYLVIAQLALTESNLTYMAAANPTTFLRLLDVIKEHFESLVEGVSNGTFEAHEQLASHIQKAIKPRLQANASRIQALKAIKGEKDITFETLWPSLQMVVTWTGGSCGVAVDSLKKQLPAYTQVFDLGYVSSEFFGAITVANDPAQSVPTLYANVFEFVERHDWESGIRETLTLSQLKLDQEYQVIVTTTSGLYRYFMNDILRVTGFMGSTPLLAFVQKGKGVTNICGEKLYESHVIQAVQAVCNQVDIQTCFYLMLADEEKYAYTLYIEPQHTPQIQPLDLASLLDEELFKLNIEYAEKRKSGRLHDVQVFFLTKGTGDKCKLFYVEKGRREQQFKLLLVQNVKDLEFPIANYISAGLEK